MGRIIMKPIFKTIIACTITAIVSVLCTIYISNRICTNELNTVYESECHDGFSPDLNGCCPGETYTDMGDMGYNCCPDDGGDCFPPIEK